MTHLASAGSGAAQPADAIDSATASTAPSCALMNPGRPFPPRLLSNALIGAFPQFVPKAFVPGRVLVPLWHGESAYAMSRTQFALLFKHQVRLCHRTDAMPSEPAEIK